MAHCLSSHLHAISSERHPLATWFKTLGLSYLDLEIPFSNGSLNKRLTSELAERKFKMSLEHLVPGSKMCLSSDGACQKTSGASLAKSQLPLATSDTIWAPKLMTEKAFSLQSWRKILETILIQNLKLNKQVGGGKVLHTIESQPINVERSQENHHLLITRDNGCRQESLMDIRNSSWNYDEKQNTDITTTTYLLITKRENTNFIVEKSGRHRLI